MTSTTNPESAQALSGERIEELQQIAGDHMFMHAAQVNDWRGKLKVYVKGEGVWVETATGERVSSNKKRHRETASKLKKV